MIKNPEFTRVQLECIYVYLAKELRGVACVDACLELRLEKKAAGARSMRGQGLFVKIYRMTGRLKEAEKRLGEIEARWYQKYMDQHRDYKKSEVVYGKEIARLQTLLESKQVESAVIYDQSSMNAESYSGLRKDELISEILRCKAALASMNNLFSKSYRGG